MAAVAATTVTGCGLTGLQQLKNLQLGWCRDLGNIMQDHTNSINALAALTGLTQLNLAGTKAGDAQLATVLPFMKRLQVWLPCSQVEMCFGSCRNSSSMPGHTLTRCTAVC